MSTWDRPVHACRYCFGEQALATNSIQVQTRQLEVSFQLHFADVGLQVGDVREAVHRARLKCRTACCAYRYAPTTSPTPTPLAPGNRHACRSGPVRSRIPATGATGAPSFAPSFEPTVLPMTPVPEAEQAAAKTVRLPCPVLCAGETCTASSRTPTRVRYESQTKHKAHPVNEQQTSAYRAVAGRQAQQRQPYAKIAAAGAYGRTSQRARSL